MVFIKLLLLTSFFRLYHTSTDVRFHSDEALYATYARDAAVFGRWMLDGPLDKPPLSIYVTALGMHFFAAHQTDLGVIDVGIRQGEFAARMPNVFAGLLAVALIYQIAWRLYGRREVALVAAALLGVSPYAVAYSASAFTDMLMVTGMLASLWLVLRGKPNLAGLMLACGFAAKPQALLYLPLVLWFLPWRFWLRYLMALASGITLLLLWDAARPETSLFTLGSINISQGRLWVTPAEWMDRLSDWLRYGGHLLGPPWLTYGLLLLAVLVLSQQRRWKINGKLVLFAVGFMLLHWLGAFFTFDRYLLPLVPVLALLAADGLTTLWRLGRWPRGLRFAVIAGIIVAAALSPYDPRADVYRGTAAAGLIDLADTLNAQEKGAIIYDRWMGWEMGYYMGAWTDKRRVYYPTPHDLALDAPRNSDQAPRYFVAPVPYDISEWLVAIQNAGFEAELFYERYGFRIYRLTQ